MLFLEKAARFMNNHQEEVFKTAFELEMQKKSKSTRFSRVFKIRASRVVPDLFRRIARLIFGLFHQLNQSFKGTCKLFFEVPFTSLIRC